MVATAAGVFSAWTNVKCFVQWHRMTKRYNRKSQLCVFIIYHTDEQRLNKYSDDGEVEIKSKRVLKKKKRDEEVIYSASRSQHETVCVRERYASILYEPNFSGQ